MTIKVLGAGCANCKRLLANVQAAVQDLKLDAKIEYITDFATIAATGLMRTPGVMFDDRIVASGHVLSKEELKDLLRSVGK